MINLKKMGKKLFSSIIATAIAGLIITVPVKADTTADAILIIKIWNLFYLHLSYLLQF